MSAEQELAAVLDGAAVVRGMALGPNLARALVRAAVAAGWEHPGARCPNCEHPLQRHDEDGVCQFTIALGNDRRWGCGCIHHPESGASDD